MVPSKMSPCRVRRLRYSSACMNINYFFFRKKKYLKNFWFLKNDKNSPPVTTRGSRRRSCARARRGAKISISGGCPPRWKKSPKMCKKWRFLLKKWRFLHEFSGGVHENECFFASIAPRLTRGCPCGKNPPIYTVLNAAFSAPTPPAGGTVVEIHLPTGPPPLPEHFSTPRKRPAQNEVFKIVVVRTSPNDIGYFV